eukprot:jgi/Mesvir1/7184/Mv19013-RA.1
MSNVITRKDVESLSTSCNDLLRRRVWKSYLPRVAQMAKEHVDSLPAFDRKIKSEERGLVLMELYRSEYRAHIESHFSPEEATELMKEVNEALKLNFSEFKRQLAYSSVHCSGGTLFYFAC